MPAASRGSRRDAMTPIAKVATDPEALYHCQCTAVSSLIASMTAVPPAIPANAPRWPTPLVNVPRKNTPRMTPLVNDAMPSTSSDDAARQRDRHDRHGDLDRTPKTAVSSRDTLR